MTRNRSAFAGVMIVLVAIVGLVVVAWAAEKEPANSGRVPLPDITEAQGESCAKDTDFIRRNHMSLLKHQRDETVHKGIRTKQYSLKECLNCHVVSGPDEQPVTAASPEHFCRSCHDYAAVKIDCFQCHSSRPEPGILPADHQPVGALPNTVGAHGIECK